MGGFGVQFVCGLYESRNACLGLRLIPRDAYGDPRIWDREHGHGTPRANSSHVRERGRERTSEGKRDKQKVSKLKRALDIAIPAQL